jgi:hypothetical protein
VGVPGAEGIGEPIEKVGPESNAARKDRWLISGGAGLFEDIRLGGRSALIWLTTLGGLSSWLLSVYWPSFVFNE